MTTMFDKFVKNLDAEGVEIDKNTGGTSALIAASQSNAKESARQVHSQCSHTNFKDCKKVADEELDKNLMDTLAANRAAARGPS